MSFASAARSPSRRDIHVWSVLGLMLAAAIAWVEPFDLVFARMTFELAPVRAAAIVVIALLGAALGKRIGLSIEGPADGRPVRDAFMAAVAAAVWCALCDWIWRPSLHPAYVDFLTTTPLALRVALYAMRAINENILYRLFLSSLLIWMLGSVWRRPDGRPAAGAFWTGLVLAQAANVWINVTAVAPLTPMALLHDVLRYVTPGVVWGWLYWRRGFAANEIACTSVHLFFQPLVVLGL